MQADRIPVRRDQKVEFKRTVSRRVGGVNRFERIAAQKAVDLSAAVDNPLRQRHRYGRCGRRGFEHRERRARKVGSRAVGIECGKQNDRPPVYVIAVDLSAVEINFNIGVQHAHRPRADRQLCGGRNGHAGHFAARAGNRKRAFLFAVADGKAVGYKVLGDDAEIAVDVIGGDFHAVDKRADIGGKHPPHHGAGAHRRSGNRQHRKQKQAERE